MQPVLSLPQGTSEPPGSLIKGVEQFAHYVINRREDGEFDTLGAGAMGITYRAFDTQLERPVALKVIHPQWMHAPEVRSRFAREAKAAARLQHPNIANILFQGEDEGVCFYAMELVAGENLHSYVTRVGALSPVHALQMAHQIALALVAADREGVLHRDLKPSNVMITSYHEGGTPHLKVIDFGLAKIASDLSGSFTTGGFIGTPEFASPEQCEEQPLDARSDLYSLGATLWFLLTARAPFSGSMLAVMKAHVSTPLPFETLPGAPEPLLKVLRRLLAKNRDGRPSTALEAAREIENAIRLLAGDRKNYTPLSGSAPAAAGQTLQPDKNSTKALVTASLCIACAAVVVGSFVVWKRGARIPSGIVPGSFVSNQEIPQTTAGRHLPHESSAQNTDQQTAFTNSLGMPFVRVPGVDVLFCGWETRVRDFAAFNQATGAAAASGGSSREPGWKAPGFPQDGNHPVVYVTVEDAKRFCEWLTTTERKAGRITADQEYRLPSRREWDNAVGLMPPPHGHEMGGPPPPPPGPGNPDARNAFPERPPRGPGSRPGPPFHWSNHAWPPPAGFGNFADESAARAGAVKEHISGWNDGFAFSSPVGRFSPNSYGISDISGNVWEMCYDGPPGSSAYGRLGGSWASAAPEDLRMRGIVSLQPTERSAQAGFRCVLAPVWK